MVAVTAEAGLLASPAVTQEREREACSQRLHDMSLHFEEQVGVPPRAVRVPSAIAC